MNRCNIKNPPLADIVRFGTLRITVSLTVFKTHILGKDFHALIRKVSFLSPLNVGSHNPPPLGGPTSSLVHRPVSGSDTICNSPNPPLEDICPLCPVTYHRQPHGFKTHLLGRCFHTLIKNVSFNPTPVGPSVLAGTPPSILL